MSIGKRLIDLARAELNSLLEKAAQDDDDTDIGHRHAPHPSGDPSALSDEELEAEMERRRRAREEVEEAVRGGRRTGAGGRGTGARTGPARRTAAGDHAIRQAYAALEIPAGSDFDTVRRSYRRLMRKYHPDLQGGSPEKQRAATDLTQRLTEAYKTLERQLRR